MIRPELPFDYLLREPKIESESPPPLLLMLHGYGSNEEDLFSFTDYLPEDLLIISLRAPYGVPPYGYAWYAIHWDSTDGKFSDTEQAKKSKLALINLLQILPQHFSFDAHRVGLMGFSQGAILSTAVGLEAPQYVKYVIGMSGYLNPELIPSAVPEGQKPRLFLSHGTQDPVIPFDWAAKSPEILTKLGVPHVFKSYPAGHTISQQNFQDMLRWLQMHK